LIEEVQKRATKLIPTIIRTMAYTDYWTP